MSDTQTPRTTYLHRWSAGVKLFGLLALSVGLVSVSAWPLQAAAALCFGGWLGWIEGWRLRCPAKRLWWPALSLLVLLLYVAWVAGVEQAALVCFRLIALVSAAILVVRTTPTIALMGVVESVLKPFGRLGWVDPARMALLFGLVLRFIPVLAQQWEEVREAQAARGLSARPSALLVPMLARTLQRADEIAEAIDARGLVPSRAELKNSGRRF